MPPLLSRVLSSHIFWIVAVGLVVRLVLGFFFSFPYDASSWARIAESSVAGTELYDRPDNYYAPVWGYILAFLAMIYTGFGGVSFGHQFDELLFLDNFTVSYFGSLLIDPGFSFVIKSFFVLVDLAVALILRRIALEITGDQKRADIVAAIWFLCPLTIYSSMVYMIFDNVEVLFLAVCLYFVLKNRPFVAGGFMLLAGMTKPFAFYLIPLLIVWFVMHGTTRTEKINNFALAVGGFALAFVVIFSFVLMAGDFDSAMVFLTGRVDLAGESVTWGLEYIFSVFLEFRSQGFIWMQPVIIGLDILFALAFFKRGGRSFRDLLFFAVLTMVVVFLWPVAQQCYYLVLIALLALLAIYWNPRYVTILMLILTIPSMACQLVAHNYSILLPLSAYTDLVSMDWVVDRIISFNTATGLFDYSLQAQVRIVIQWVIIAAMLHIAHSLCRRRNDETY